MANPDSEETLRFLSFQRTKPPLAFFVGPLYPMNLSPFEERTRATGAKFGLSVDTIRPKIAEGLSAIRTSGFFRTYTDHSITHCDQMFSILSWLIPQPVQASLTDVECALLTMSVYLHDFGMLATNQEFENRATNETFRRFEQNYTQSYDTASRPDIDHSTFDHFLFEEFVRHTHGQRIFEWLSSGHANGAIQGDEISGILHSTEKNFRHYLGVICRSHHLTNLHDRTSYPLEFRFGNRVEDQANIQFLAVCLRMADILHMSRDRTPSLEFRLISPRNPISAREWAKQLQVSGVCPSSIDPSEILVNAVCTDHRMYFYLRDFVAVADAELQQCRAWLDSVPAPIASRYHFKVRRVSDQGIHAHGFIAERFELHLDQPRVIDLLMGHNLYGDSKVAIRELIQNSIDAVRVRRIEEPMHNSKLRLVFNTASRTLTVTDNGIGMTLDVIRQHFLRVGDSYYRSSEFRRRCPGYTSISQFGIGFLTAFMIAERVEVLTYAPRYSSKAIKIVLEDIYDLFAATEIASDDPSATPVAGGGTHITLSLRKDITFEKLAEEVSRWLVFLEFAIEVVVDDSPPQYVHGIKGQTPDDIGDDIKKLCAEPYEDYCPIVFNNDGVQIVVLWEADRLGDNYLLAPAGRYLLPLTASLYRGWSDRHDGPRRTKSEPRVIRKIANGGIFLASELPGFKAKERSRLHYIIDCRGELRFTPLVSRAGIAIDRNSVAILSQLVKGLVDFVIANTTALMATGVSKYFSAYYAACALSVLFDRKRMEDDTEKVLSAVFAANEARRVPMLLLRKGNDIALSTWAEHAEKPIVVGRNMYDSLLRSVTRGTVEFPIPKEVLASLPENYIVPADIDDILRPLLFLSSYVPTEVTYEPLAKGIFVTCKVGENPGRKLFSDIIVLPFPDELAEVTLLDFALVRCWNLTNAATKTWFEMSEGILRRTGESKRKEVEERIRSILASDSRDEMDFELREDRLSERSSHIARQLSETAGVPVSVPEDAVKALRGGRVVRDRLWQWRHEF